MISELRHISCPVLLRVGGAGSGQEGGGPGSSVMRFLGMTNEVTRVSEVGECGKDRGKRYEKCEEEICGCD
jgi:hypothetical protein